MSEIIGHLLAAGQRAEVLEGRTRVVTSSWAQAIRVRREEPELDELPANGANKPPSAAPATRSGGNGKITRMVPPNLMMELGRSAAP